MHDSLRAHWRSIPPGERHRFSGVTALCCDERGELIGDPFPRDPLDAGWWDIHLRYALRGEKWVSRRYETRHVNEILRVYYRGGDDQLTRLSPRAWARFRSWYAQRLCEDREWLTVAPLVLLKLAIHYARFSFLSGDPVRAQIAPLATIPLKLLWAAASPVGLVLSLRDRVRESAAGRGGSRPARPPRADSQ